MNYSDYIIYADESGGPNPTPVDPNYPVFVLNFCVFRKDRYADSVLPAVSAFKFEHFGHDDVVLHENVIRFRRQPFVFLRDERKRDTFMAGLAQIVRDTDFTIIAAVVDKRQMAHRYVGAQNVYELALGTCIERLHDFLTDRGQHGRITHVVIESRGKGGDNELEHALRRIRAGINSADDAKTGLEIRFADKKSNLAGLQVADLTARPIGRHVIEPNQSDRAWTSLKPKLMQSSKGNIDGWGLTILPK